MEEGVRMTVDNEFCQFCFSRPKRWTYGIDESILECSLKISGYRRSFQLCPECRTDMVGLIEGFINKCKEKRDQKLKGNVRS